MGLDIGPKTVAAIVEEMKKAKNVVWNGPMGVFEFAAFAASCFGNSNFYANFFYAKNDGIFVFSCRFLQNHPKNLQKNSFSCKNLQLSCKVMQNLARTCNFPAKLCKFLQNLSGFLQNHAKICEILQLSCKILQRNFIKFLQILFLFQE